MTKRITALLLALLMVIGTIPTPVFAADGSNATEETTQTICSVCNLADCTATHTQCEKCGNYDCTTDHTNWCDTCKVDNCGADHGTAASTTVCEVCGNEVCTCESTAETTAPVDNCPYCEETTAEDGTVTHTEGCNAAYAYDGTADVGKYVQLNSEYAYITVSDGSNQEELSFTYEEFASDLIFVITDWKWDPATTALWYQVDAYQGTPPADLPADAWILQNYTNDTAVDSLLFITACDICGKFDCTVEHVKCDKCGEYDCTILHFYCESCKAYDCGLPHLYCNVCNGYDCGKLHVWCGACGEYDCGITHEDIKPATVPVIPESPTLTEGTEVSIVDEYGDPVTEEGFVLFEGTKSSLSAWSELEGDFSYQWQICYDSANDLWVDIQGQNEKGILVSPAMFLPVLEDQGTVAIRCVVTSGEEIRISNAIPVSIMEPVSLASFALTSDASPAAETDNSEDLQKAYVVVQYVYEDGRTAAATSFAEIIPGSAYSYSYNLPDIAGYQATLDTHNYGDAAKIDGDTLKLNFAAGVLTENYTIFTVTYVPDFVSYTVIHYWQYHDTDNYTEHERETISNTHKTGDVITDAHNSYDGFYNLLYETPAAAADGSTVIEVYYDRYYYLMTFDLGENGYGVDPVYARYGAELEIGIPTRAGYTFLGWKLNGEGDIITAADMLTTMPYENRKYIAQWQAADTAKVSVVFWGENADDEGYSYVETKELFAKPGISYTFSGNGGLICGTEAHTHDSTCKRACGLTEHSHTQSCYTLICTNTHTAHTDACWNCGETVHTHGESCCTLTPHEHTAGCCNNNENMHWLFHIGGWNSTYCNTNECSNGGTEHTHGDGSCTCDKEIHTHTDACCGEALHTHTAYTGNCYKLTCTAQAHTHSDACGDYSCGMVNHIHTNACYDNLTGLDSELWTFVKSDTVTVDADGSTVVNVYYDRIEKTLTFKYNYSNRTYQSTKTITAKWGADISKQYVAIAEDAGTFWAAEDSNSGPYTNYFGIMPQKSATYYNRGSSGSDGTMTYYGESLTGEYVKMFSVPDVGGYTVTDEDRYEFEGFSYDHGTSNGSSCSGATFYYNRHKYAIEFYNPTTLLKKETGIFYEAALGSYDFTPTSDQAPAVYEPGSVQFAGWYLNPECTGDRYYLADHTMPSATEDGATALVLYAKWEPVEYKVNYYLTRDSLDRNENIPAEMTRLATAAGRTDAEPYVTVFAEDIVKHGAYIQDPDDPGVSEGYANIHPRAGYEFIGWFYLNEDGKETAFDPENMPVDRNLDLYGKWSSNVLCRYNIYFALDKVDNDTGAEGADGKADLDENGNIIYIADTVAGSGIAGRTFTFTAKGGDDLYTAYQDGYFPTVGSHSIVIDIKDENGTGTNSFTFLYQPKQAVPYTVRYINKDTGAELLTEKVVSDNKNIVVTENFVYIQGYMPDAYQKTLVVTAEGPNEIIFYYTADTEHSLYVINYYIQELDSNLDHVGWRKYADLQSTGDIGTKYTAEAYTIDGFTLSAAYTNDYNVTKKVNAAEKNEDGTYKSLPTEVSSLTATDGKSTITGTLTDKGMELNFYYTRNLYPYEFRYMLNGTTTELAEPKVGKAGYDTIVREVAKEIEIDLDDDGIYEDYRLYDPTETTKDIHIIVDGQALSAGDTVTKGQATVNVTTFYYVRCTQTMTITKTVVDNSDESDPDPDQEFTFSLLIHAKNGYHQTSYDYTKSDGTSGTLSPVITAPNTLQFTLKAGQTITIDGLPTAEYTVSELNPPTGYYDTYSPAQRNKLTVDSRLDVTVTNTYDPANLTIKKTVDVVEEGTNTPEVTDFQFAITVPNGVTGTYEYTVGTDAKAATVTNGAMTITLQNGQTATFTNLPVGEYTVTEAAYESQGYNDLYSVNDAEAVDLDSATVTLTRGTTQTVECLNKFPVGDLVIEKTVTKEFYGTDWNGDTFTFTVERTTEGRPLVANNQYKVLIDGVEQDATIAVDDDGKLTVRITFDGTDAAKLDEETEANDSASHTLTIKNLPAGTYKVTEAANTAYTQNPTDLTVSVTIPAETMKAEYVNQLKRPAGSLSLTKILEAATGFNPSELPKGTKFSFTIELTEQPPTDSQTFTVVYDETTFTGGDATPTSVTMANGTFTVELEAGQMVTINGLPIGKYRITEATIPQYANNFAHIVNGVEEVQTPKVTSDGCLYTEINVPANGTAEIKCTNTYPVDRAELIIQKLVTKEYERDTLPTQIFTFTVTLTEEDTGINSYAYKVYNSDGTEDIASSGTAPVTNKIFTIQLEAGQYAVIPNMPVCGYTVSENVDTTDYNASYKVYVSETGEGASTQVNTTGTANTSGTGVSVNRTFSAGKTDTVVFTNEYKQHLGTLTITKTVNGGSADDTFIFHIKGTDTSNSYIDMDVTITGSGSVTIYDLPLGSYTVTEDTDWNWRYTQTGSNTTDNTIKLNDLHANVTFTNVRDTDKWLNFTANMPNVFGKKEDEQEGS